MPIECYGSKYVANRLGVDHFTWQRTIKDNPSAAIMAAINFGSFITGDEVKTPKRKFDEVMENWDSPDQPED